MDGTNMRSIELPIVGSTKFDRYKKQSIESTYNMIISDSGLVPFAGYKKVLTIVAGDVSAREIYRSVKRERLVVVVDADVFLINKNFAISFIGSLQSQAGVVYISENNADQIAIVDGLFVYIYNTTTQKFTTVTDIPFQPVYIDFQDTYFIIPDGVSHEWFLSAPNNGLVWPTGAQNVGQLQTKPDTMIAVVRFNRQLFVMGKKTTEIWHDVGARLFPYQRDNSLSIDYGCLNAATIASGFGLLVWLAVNEKAGPTIMVSRGGNARQISTDGINFVLDKLDAPEDASGFLFEEDGHIFYLITFRTDNISYVYDFNTNKFYDVTDECLNAHLATRIAFFDNTHYFISSENGDLYEMGTDFSTFKYTLDPDDKGKTIPRIRILPPFRKPDASRYVINNISVTTEMGNAFPTRPEILDIETTFEEVPQVVDLSMSKDGGQTFGTVVRKEFNRIGNRRNRLRWFNLGSSNDTTFQFRFWGKYRFVITSATMEYFE